ncbi:MAG: hypothetical protein MPK62_05805, partial [Alphaproteobacteria bacterium]|nr:hypothetical protein [Alphaproteobacteria bacterium]
MVARASRRITGGMPGVSLLRAKYHSEAEPVGRGKNVVSDRLLNSRVRRREGDLNSRSLAG